MSLALRDQLSSFSERMIGYRVASESFVPATIESIQYVEEVKCRSPRTGTLYKGIAGPSERLNNRIRELTPNLCLKLSVPAISESVVIDVEPKDVIPFGSVSYINGQFTLESGVTDVEVKVRDKTVQIRDVGTFNRVSEKSRHISTYGSGSSYNFEGGYLGTFDGIVGDELRLAWFQSRGCSEGVWRVKNVEESSWRSSIRIEVDHPMFKRDLKFSLSLQKVKNDLVAKSFLIDDAGGIVDHLEEQEVFVSLIDYKHSESISSDGPWKLYRKNDRPNIIRRMMASYF